MTVTFRQACLIGQYTKLADAGEQLTFVNMGYPGSIYIGAANPPAAGVTTTINISASKEPQIVGPADNAIWFRPYANASEITTVDVQGIKGTPIGAAGGAGESHIGEVGGKVVSVSATFARPGDTTAYTIGDLVANNVTAGSVVAMVFAVSRVAGKSSIITRARLRKSTVTTANASFRLHLFSTAPTVANGDNGVWNPNNSVNYLGSFDFNTATALSDGAVLQATPNVGNFISAVTDNVYGILEARGAYAPGNAENFAVALEVSQN